MLILRDATGNEITGKDEIVAYLKKNPFPGGREAVGFVLAGKIAEANKALGGEEPDADL